MTAIASVAIVHDYLTQRGGAERVVLALARGFPGVPIHTSLYEPSRTFAEFEDLPVRPSSLDRLGALRAHHRLALPLLAPTFSAMRVDADVVICSSSGWAHGARTDGRKIVYCHAPARWLYQAGAYASELGAAAKVANAVLRRPLAVWDRRAAASADLYVVNSTRTRELVRSAYGIDAEIVHPPCGIDPVGQQVPVAGLEPGYLLCVSRLLPYKQVDIVLAALAARPHQRLVVVGRGPDEARLRSLAPRNAAFIMQASDAELRWLYANASALIGASVEDFGLTPVEAAAFGTPTIAWRFGGYLDTVVEGETGVFFDEPTAAALAEALDRYDPSSFDGAVIRAHARRFDESAFVARMRAIAS